MGLYATLILFLFSILYNFPFSVPTSQLAVLEKHKEGQKLWLLLALLSVNFPSSFQDGARTSES